MRVRLLRDVKLYWNYAVHELEKGTEHIGDLARHLLDNAPEGSVEALEKDPEPAKKPEPKKSEPKDDEVPEQPAGAIPPVDGTIDDLMTWVGDDKARTREALDAEKAKDKPRSTVVKRLTALVDDES